MPRVKNWARRLLETPRRLPRRCLRVISTEGRGSWSIYQMVAASLFEVYSKGHWFLGALASPARIQHTPTSQETLRQRVTLWENSECQGTVGRAPAASAVMLSKLLLYRTEWNLPRAIRNVKWLWDLKSLTFTHLLQMHVFNSINFVRAEWFGGSAISKSSRRAVFILTPSHRWDVFHTQAMLQMEQ